MAESAKAPATDVSPYLKQVRVRDYPPLRDAKVGFKQGLNIVIGKNGAGKTRFLSLVRNLIDIEQAHLEGVGCQITIQSSEEVKVGFKEEKRVVNDKHWHFVDAPSFLRVEVDVNGALGSDETLSRALWPSGGPLLFLAYSSILIRHGIPSFNLPVIAESADWSLSGRTLSVDLKSGKKYLYDIESQFVQKLFRQIFDAVRGHFPEVQPKFPLPAEWVRERIKLIAEGYVKFFNNYLPIYSPIHSVRIGETFQVYYISAQDEYIIKGLELEYCINSEWLPFSKLSDGIKRLFYIITELVSPNTLIKSVPGQENEWYDAKKIILLEEPELGVHPHQLHLLLNLIREVSREHQVIMTTHAPQVLDMLAKNELDRITICELDPKKGTQFRKLSRTKQAQARIYMQETGFLSDYWRYSYLEGNGTH